MASTNGVLDGLIIINIVVKNQKPEFSIIKIPSPILNYHWNFVVKENHAATF